jgi:hypothetical protein
VRRGVGSDSDDREEVDLMVYHESPAAVLVQKEPDVWLPKSQIDTSDGGPFRVKKVNKLLVPQWLLEKKGLA